MLKTMAFGAALVLVSAAARALNFDQGAGVSEFLAQAHEGAAAMPSAPSRFRASDYRERRCAYFSFGPQDSTTSQTLRLYSTEWRRECYPRGGDPRRGGGGWDCYDRPGYTYSEDVRVSLTERKPLLPWETDNFEACLEGPWLDVYSGETAYHYRQAGSGSFRGDFRMAPGQKQAEKPDASGIALQSYSQRLVLTLSDRWASYYKGEQTGIKVKLKDNGWFGGSTVAETELTVPSAGSYAIDVAELAKKAGKSLKAGDKYYVEYKWRRVGPTSKNDWMKEHKTDKTVYQASFEETVAEN